MFRPYRLSPTAYCLVPNPLARMTLFEPLGPYAALQSPQNDRLRGVPLLAQNRHRCDPFLTPSTATLAHWKAIARHVPVVRAIIGSKDVYVKAGFQRRTSAINHRLPTTRTTQAIGTETVTIGRPQDFEQPTTQFRILPVGQVTLEHTVLHPLAVAFQQFGDFGAAAIHRYVV